MILVFIWILGAWVLIVAAMAGFIETDRFNWWMGHYLLTLPASVVLLLGVLVSLSWLMRKR